MLLPSFISGLKSPENEVACHTTVGVVTATTGGAPLPAAPVLLPASDIVLAEILVDRLQIDKLQYSKQ